MTVAGQKGLILKLLSEKDIASASEVIEYLWPGRAGPPERSLNQVTTLVNELRKQGYKIERVTGYRLRFNRHG